MSSYLHSVIIYIAVLTFAYTTWFTAEAPLGSISSIYENLKIRSAVRSQPAT